MTETTQIEAGRELDALVAVEVMGYTWLQQGATAPMFSTTGDGMFAVLERMWELGWGWQLQSRPGGQSAALFARGPQSQARHGAATADSLPHAVCLAALEAVRA